ncbi:MAG: LLM class flavin-dependent oxidoreductase, partial [Solirubrobacteraceae bacterium]
MTDTFATPPGDELAVYLMPGRVKGPTDGGDVSPRRALEEAQDAERLGIRTAYLAERYDLKYAPALLGGAGAVTKRLELGTGAVTAFSRHPLLMAAFAATMQAAYGERFVLGLGRGSVDLAEAQHPFGSGFDGFADFVSIVRRLLHGETVDYDGPAGRYERLRLLDSLDVAPPEVICCNLGGPKAVEVAARVGDGMMLPPMLTPEASARAVEQFR